MRPCLHFAAYLVVSAGLLHAQIADIIPADRRIDWTIGTYVGVRGGIPTRTDVHATVPVLDATTTIINAALTAAAAVASVGAPKVVMLEAGTYTLASTVVVPSYVTLRGVSNTATILRGTAPNSLLRIGSTGSGVSAFGTISAGYTKGSTYITGAATPAVAAGNFICVSQDNEAWMYNPNGTANVQYAMHRVEAVSIEAGTNYQLITLFPPLVYASVGNNPKFLKLNNPVTVGASIENLATLNEVDGSAIVVAASYNSWVKNVRMHDVQKQGIWAYQSLNCEFTHVDGVNCVSAGDGYGIYLASPAVSTRGINACAVYDCFMIEMYHGFMGAGHNSSVFAYNYTANEHTRSGVTYGTAGFNASHAAEGIMGLWEGNYGNILTSDIIHGSAGYQTVYRNRFHGNNIFNNLAKVTGPIFLTTGSNYWNFVGNVLGDTLGGLGWPSGGQSFYKYKWTYAERNAAGNANLGGIYMLGWQGFGVGSLDANVAATALFYDNFDYWNSSRMDTGAYAIPDSLAWTSKPAFFASLEWPPYDPTTPITWSTTAAVRIPAGYRYVNGEDPPAQLEGGTIIGTLNIGALNIQ